LQSLAHQTKLHNPNNSQSKSVSPRLITIDPSSRNYMVTIKDRSLSEIILNASGDSQKLSILKTILGKPMTIYEILNKCKISSTSGYRKINSLIQGGLLVKNDLVITRDSKKVIRYKSLFDNFDIHIEKGKVTVKAQFTS